MTLDKLRLSELYSALEAETDRTKRKALKNEIIERTRQRVEASRGTNGQDSDPDPR